MATAGKLTSSRGHLLKLHCSDEVVEVGLYHTRTSFSTGQDISYTTSRALTMNGYEIAPDYAAMWYKPMGLLRHVVHVEQ